MGMDMMLLIVTGGGVELQILHFGFFLTAKMQPTLFLRFLCR